MSIALLFPVLPTKQQAVGSEFSGHQNPKNDRKERTTFSSTRL